MKKALTHLLFTSKFGQGVSLGWAIGMATMYTLLEGALSFLAVLVQISVVLCVFMLFFSAFQENLEK